MTGRPADVESSAARRGRPAALDRARGHDVVVEDDRVAGEVRCIRVDDALGILPGADPRGEVRRRMPSYAVGW